MAAAANRSAASTGESDLAIATPATFTRSSPTLPSETMPANVTASPLFVCILHAADWDPSARAEMQSDAKIAKSRATIATVQVAESGSPCASASRPKRRTHIRPAGGEQRENG